MKAEHISDAMERIDEELIIPVEEKRIKQQQSAGRRRLWLSAAAAAACVGIIAAGSLILPELKGVPVTAPVTGITETSVSETSPTETSAPDTEPPETSAPVIVSETSETSTAISETSPTETSAPDTEPPETSAPVIVSETSETSTVVSDTSPTETSAAETEPPETSAPAIVTPDPDDDGNPIGGSDEPDDDDYDDDDNVVGGGGGNKDYPNYGTPVMPLTLLNADSSITAKRNTVYDFSEWEVNDLYPDIDVTDEYILTNTSDEDKEVTVVYPYARQAGLCEIYTPTLKVNGTKAEQTHIVGPATWKFLNKTYSIDSLYKWDEYKQLLSDGKYFDRAMNYKLTGGDTPVTLYKFNDITEGLPRNRYEWYCTKISYNCDEEKTKILAYSLFDECTSGYIIVIGEDITDLSFDLYLRKELNGEIIADEKMPDDMFKSEVTRTETTLDGAMREFLLDFKTGYDKRYENVYDRHYKPTPDDFECFYAACCELYDSIGVFSEEERYTYLRVYTDEVNLSMRMFYVTAQVTIPAGESVTVTADMKNGLATHDFCLLASGNIHAYDLATTLGSNLEFTDVSAELKNCGYLDVTNENFGFDIENGVTKVKLDPSVEHYYIEARIKYPEQP